jgi:hypothetical protein
VISRADEQKILDQYVALLEDARERLRKKEEGIESIRSEVANLEAIVNGVSSRIPGVTGDAASSGIAFVEPVGSVRRGLPTLTSVIRQIMADGRSRNAEEILAEIAKRGDETAAQGTRQQIANRLVELKNQGYLEPIIGRRGFYKLASTEAGPNDTGREGPLLPVHPSYQKPLGGELSTPHPGHPYSLEGAPGVAHQAGS